MGTSARYTWTPITVGHPGLVLHLDGNISIGGCLYGPTDEIKSVRLAPFTFNRSAGATLELSGISDKGEICEFRFDAVGRVWLQKFLWKNLPADFNAGAFRLLATGEVVFFDGAVARAATPFARRLRIGGLSVEVSRSAGSVLVMEQSRKATRRYAWEGGGWHELFSYFPAARASSGAKLSHVPSMTPSASAPLSLDPCLPEPVWRRYPIERIGDAAGSHQESNFVAIGDVCFLKDGSIVLGDRAFPGGSEIAGFRFGGYVAHRAAGAHQLLSIDRPGDGETSYYGCWGKWYRYVPVAAHNVWAYSVGETIRQSGCLAPLALSWQVAQGLGILAIVTGLAWCFFFGLELIGL